MARSRNIKPGLFDDEILGEADPIYTVLFCGLWTVADKEGRLEDRPMRIRKQILGYRNVDVNLLLDWLNVESYLIRYQVEGRKYIQILNWGKHQNPHYKEADSDIPEYVKGSEVAEESVAEQGDGQRQSDVDPTLNQTQANVDSTSPPDSLLLDSFQLDSLQPDSFQPAPTVAGLVKAQPDKSADRKKTPAKKKKSAGVSTPTWDAYSQSYLKRYGVEPRRSSKISTSLVRMVEHIGVDSAPLVAAYYPTSNYQFYVARGHPIELMVADAQKLLTEAQTGKRATATQAKQLDRKENNANVANEVIARLEARGEM